MALLPSFVLTTLLLGACASNRDSKFLGLFNVVQFANDVCNSSLSNEQGTCYTTNECQDFGGRPTSSCASGFGVCCVFSQGCRGNRLKATDVAYFRNDKFPETNTEPNMCMFSIPVQNDNICQIRLDFLEFNLDGGSDVNSPCDRDYLEIFTNSGSDGLGMGKLCGLNKGQHVYIPIQSQFDAPSLRVVTDSRRDGTEGLSADYQWNIMITQIDCATKAGLKLKAPEGCLQYFKERSGTLTSFNWSVGKPRQYVPNQNYAICIKRMSSDCELQLISTQGLPDDSTSIGKAKLQTTNDNKCKENGCGASACISSNNNNPGTNNKMGTDRLEIGSFYKDKTGNKEFYHAEYIYCGKGIGQKDTTTNNIIDETGIISQSKGPFVISFIADEFPGDVTPMNIGNQNQQDPGNELGFSIDYKVKTSCSRINLDSQ